MSLFKELKRRDEFVAMSFFKGKTDAVTKDT